MFNIRFYCMKMSIYLLMKSHQPGFVVNMYALFMPSFQILMCFWIRSVIEIQMRAFFSEDQIYKQIVSRFLFSPWQKFLFKTDHKKMDSITFYCRLISRVDLFFVKLHVTLSKSNNTMSQFVAFLFTLEALVVCTLDVT